MRLRIGITGGIGSGKSIVANVFRLHNIPVYNADESARRIMSENQNLQQAVVDAFGRGILEGKTIDRAKLGALVFADESQLALLNAIVHPYVLKDYITWENLQHAPYTLREAAILFETGLWKDMDHTILVDAPEELRLQRVMTRDTRNESEIRNIFRRQWTSEKKRALAWRIIENDNHHLVIPQVNVIHNELMYA